jgi:hypothetical protein
MLSWERADAIVRLAATEPEARAYFAMSAPYRDYDAAEAIHAARDRTKDSDREAMLFGDDIEAMTRAQFCERLSADDVRHVRALARLLASVEDKPTGPRRRLLGWPRAMNEAERAILRALEVFHHAKVPFPTAASSRDTGMRFDAAASLDFKKFFQQFKLLVWQFYAFLYKGTFYRLATIPTGAVGPPIFAQVLSRAILALAIRTTAEAHDQVASDCMIDNLRLVSDDMHALRAAWHCMLNICDYVGITVGEVSPPAHRGSSPYTFLGIRFGTAATPSERILAKLQRFDALLSTGKATAIDLSAGFGLCIFASQALRRSLAREYYVIKFMRRVSRASMAHSWNRTVVVWPCIIAEWASWIRSLRTESYTPRRPHPFTVTMYTDASETGWGVVLIYGDRAWSRGGPWSDAESKLHINVLELEAIRIGLRLAAAILGPCTVNALVDNTTAISWASRGRSRNYLANEIIKQMGQEAAALGITLASLEYIESARNLADKPSRATQLRRPRSTTPQ